MTLKVVDFKKRAPEPSGVESLLDEVKGEGLDTVVIIGYSGDLLHFYATNISAGEIIYVIEKIKFNLFAGAYDDEDEE